MEIKIAHTLLTDTPLIEGPAMQLLQMSEELTSFIDDLRNGNPSCYLVSGYRGSGKTSAIKYIEKQITDSPSPKGPKTIFAYVNFSRYTEPKFARRQIIRALHNTLLVPVSGTLPVPDTGDSPTYKNALQLLDSVYNKTFWETSTESTDSTQTEKSIETQLNYMRLFQTVVPLLFGTALIVDASTNAKWFKIISGILFFGVGALSDFYLWTKKQQHTTRNLQEEKKKTLYDDEIADYYLEQILQGLKEKYRVIFVFDELDKLENNIIDRLFEEVKFLLISGHAGFVMVAGQELYYKYASSSREDDALLSSLFARHIHVRLMSREAMQLFFDKLSNDLRLALPQREQDILNAYIDKLIFTSRRVPRKFVNIIRQQLEWKNGEAILRINDDMNVYKSYSTLLNCIEKVDNVMISSERYDKALQDYFMMQLFEKAQQMLFDGHRQFSLTQIMHTNEQEKHS